jgi:hypothetical protein
VGVKSLIINHKSIISNHSTFQADFKGETGVKEFDQNDDPWYPLISIAPRFQPGAMNTEKTKCGRAYTLPHFVFSGNPARAVSKYDAWGK